jgi:hypothetical protein
VWRLRGSGIAYARAFATQEEALAAAGLAEADLQPLALAT